MPKTILIVGPKIRLLDYESMLLLNLERKKIWYKRTMYRCLIRLSNCTIYFVSEQADMSWIKAFHKDTTIVRHLNHHGTLDNDCATSVITRFKDAKNIYF